MAWRSWRLITETFLNNIRKREKSISKQRQIINTITISFSGVFLGVFSKYLDSTASNKLPQFLEITDIRNFLGRFAIWILLALCISIYSYSPIRAAINVFAFFTGMVGSYYLYSKCVAGFFPKNYVLIWVLLTAVSPLLAFICWYATGTGKTSLAISSLIIAVLFNVSFAYGWLYFNMLSVLELITFIYGVVVLRRKSAKGTIIMTAIGIVAALFIHLIIPLHF